MSKSKQRYIEGTQIAEEERGRLALYFLQVDPIKDMNLQTQFELEHTMHTTAARTNLRGSAAFTKSNSQQKQFIQRSDAEGK
jgi:hypothetical protein